jgi:hypothetical protein
MFIGMISKIRDFQRNVKYFVNNRFFFHQDITEILLKVALNTIALNSIGVVYASHSP